MQQNTPSMTREEMDAMVAEAVSTWPEAALDQSIVNDLPRAAMLMQLADEFHRELAPMYERISTELDKPADDRTLTNFEGMFMEVIPAVYEGVDPKSHVQAALIAAVAVQLCAARARSEAGPDTPEADIVTAARTFLQDDLGEIVPVILEIPKDELLTVGVRIVRMANRGRQTLEARKNATTPTTEHDA